ncbi:hypothetical protein M5E87_05245 [Flavonifractor plautii]|nr:hypothetical protein M5E87_05245 [Flavonifractor plautii]
MGRDKAYCHIEKLTNLDQLPVTGFKVSCFPVSIKAASKLGPCGGLRGVTLLLCQCKQPYI